MKKTLLLKQVFFQKEKKLLRTISVFLNIHNLTKKKLFKILTMVSKVFQ